MKNYDKNAALRRARMEVALVFKRIQEELHDRIKEYVDAATTKALADGTPFDVDSIGKAAAAYGAEPWSIGTRPALQYKPARSRRKK